MFQMTKHFSELGWTTQPNTAHFGHDPFQS